MKKNNWILYLFEDDRKRDLLKIMEFRRIKDIAYVLDIEASVISNWYHGLINDSSTRCYCTNSKRTR
jgi:hypothetical protein